jgi:G3E family GTPase
MVEENFDEAVEDDAPFDDFVEADESEEEDDYSEEMELPDEEEEQPEEEVEEEVEEQPQQTEPAWIKQRVQKAVDKAVAQALAAQQEEFDRRMAPIIAKMQEDEAQELVRSRKITDIETAREFVRMKHGQGTGVNSQPSQPRNENGQFASKEQIVKQAKTEARIDMLAAQADKIKADGGPDVIQIFQNDEDIKEKVINGEMDFYDVAKTVKPTKKPPSPTRSPNGANNVTSNAFANMSSKQFERMERQIDRGVRYTMR